MELQRPAQEMGTKHPNRKVHDNPASLRHFLREKLYFFLLFFIILVLLLLFLTALRTSSEAIIVVVFLFTAFSVTIPIVEYWRRRNFYQKLLQNIANLDRAYLVLETLTRPNFYDGAILYEALYAINKSMAEVVQNYDLEAREFRDYIEMWIHEVKTPLVTLSLMTNDRKISAQINRLDSYVEQVLYFARAENAEHDYLIKPVSLDKIISVVATKNRDLLLASNVDFIATGLNHEVFTDSKWLEFILNQIIQNSIKYHSKTIRLSAASNDEGIILTIADDGIGISAKDLPRVFEKSFTGENGHDKANSKHGNSLLPSGGQKSTGMGLYIAKTLCDKLGHQITVSSPNRHGTTVQITFPRHDYYTIMRPENHTSAPKQRTFADINHTPASEKHDISKK